ncbi:MAG: family 16 glycosylhydrolase [Phycisphaerales bacterium]|nr:family 16 glycosylhydrolase [Phycisphaerales bacterium]
MRRNTITALAAIPLGFAFVSAAAGQTLVWSDDFDGPAIDLTKWTFNTGGSGFGNGELQYYTARTENAFIENGSLVIEARRENYLGDKAFTSSRLLTNGRFSFKYGTIEARIKLPNVDYGLWPALWIMGDSFGALNWPACGEVDIMEFGRKDGLLAGTINQRVSSAAHWELNDEHVYVTDYTDRPTVMYDDYHLFKLEWTPTHFQTFVDDVPFWNLDISDPQNDDLEEFHKPMFLLTNLAVGGWNFIEITDPNAISATFPARMYIDYIRLYDNGDTELFYGDERQETGDFGVFTETTPVNNSVQYDVDAALYIWNNLTETAGAAYEGAESWSFHADPGVWWGMGVLSTQFDRNLKNYSDGSMHLHMKTSSTAPFKIGVKSTTSGESWVKFDSETDYGLVRDGSWHEVVIPLNNFLNCDFNTVTQLFMIAGDPPSSGVDFSIDNVYWTPSVPRPTPENGNFGIFTEDPAHKTAGEYQLGVDGGFYVWEHTLVDLPQDPYEGSASLAFQSAPGLTWFGAAFTPAIKYNLSAFRFPESKLHFALKTNSTVDFRLGMRSGNVDDIGQKWIDFKNGNDPYGFVRNGNWHVVEIPMADIIDAVNLTEVSMLFEVLGVNGPITNIEFDDVCLLGGGTALSAGGGYPVADAGQDLVVILPNNSVVIDGTNSHDDGTITDFAWQQISGPSTAGLSGANTPILTASNLIQGVYKFRLTVTDDDSLTDIDDVLVTVTTTAPTANAGADQSITLPGQNSVTLAGSGSDADGFIIEYAWSQVSGPTTATLVDADMATATASNLFEGTYVFELTVTDNDLNTGSDQISVVVTNPPQNVALGKPTTTSSTGSGDLVRNGGFEAGAGTDADNWMLLAFPAGSSIATSTRTSSLPHNGTWHLSLYVAGAANGGPAALGQQETPAGSVVPGNSYDLKVQARRVGALGVSVVAQLNMQWLNSSGAVVGGTGFVDIGNSLTESYSEIGISNAVAPAGADRALILLRLAGGAIAGSTAEVLFDDVSLTTVGAATGGENAVDGDAGTAWSSAGGDPQWIEVALGDRYAISQFVLKWGSAFAQEYDIDVSDDGVNWSTVFSSSSGAGGTDTIDLAADAAFIRLYSHVGGTTNGCSLKEFEAYGFIASSLGDMNQNGIVEVGDIPHFVDALLGNPPMGPGIAQNNADMNDDGMRNGNDIQLFVDALIP